SIVMKAMFVHSTPFIKYNNKYYSQQFPYEVWESRYLKYFDELYVVGRDKAIEIQGGYSLSSGEKVHHILLPNLLGPVRLLKKRSEIYKLIENHLIKNNINILIARLPSEYSLLAIE